MANLFEPVVKCVPHYTTSIPTPQLSPQHNHRFTTDCSTCQPTLRYNLPLQHNHPNTQQAFLHHKLPYNTTIHSPQTAVHVNLSYVTTSLYNINIQTLQVYLHYNLPYTTKSPTLQYALHLNLPYTTNCPYNTTTSTPHSSYTIQNALQGGGSWPSLHRNLPYTIIFVYNTTTWLSPPLQLLLFTCCVLLSHII